MIKMHFADDWVVQEELAQSARAGDYEALASRLGVKPSSLERYVQRHPSIRHHDAGVVQARRTAEIRAALDEALEWRAAIVRARIVCNASKTAALQSLKRLLKQQP